MAEARRVRGIPKYLLIGRARHALTLAMAGGLLGCCAAPSQVPAGGVKNAIVVGSPKVYDDHYLEAQLAATKARLAALQPIDSGSITKQYGAVEGASLQQSGLALQAIGQATPSVTTAIPTVANTAGAPAFVQTTSQDAIKPSAPSIPQTAPQFPASTSASSLDILAEQMQLAYQATDWQLLLNGALSDRYQLRGGLKRRVTIGLPVTIAQPQEGMEDHIAEVEVTICNSAEKDAGFDPPSIVTLLPTENTYNTVSITDDEKQAQFGLVAGIFNLGGGFLRANKTYYMVKHQDTVALERVPRTDAPCGLRKLSDVEESSLPTDPAPLVLDSTTAGEAEQKPLNTVFKSEDGYYKRIPRATFAWEFRPALGSRYVKAGIRQNFVQLALPSGQSLCSGRVFVRTRWLPLNKGDLAVGDADWSKDDSVVIADLYQYDTKPYSLDLHVDDIGSGMVSVSARGAFLPGIQVRIGGAPIDPTAPTFYADTGRVQFTATAAALIANKVFLVGTDSEENELRFWPKGVNPYKPVACKAPPIIKPLPAMFEAWAATIKANQEFEAERRNRAKAQLRPGERLFDIPDGGVTVTPYSDASSRVSIKLRHMSPARRKELTDQGAYLPADEKGFMLVALVAGKVFGLNDAPFLERTSNDDRLDVVVSNDAILKSPTVIVKRILMGDEYSSRWAPIPASPLQISKVVLANTDASGEITLAITGTGLADLDLKLPKPADKGPSVERVNAAFALIRIPKGDAVGLKQVVVENKAGYRVALAMPDDAKQAAPVATGPALKDANAVIGDKQVTLSGTNIEKVVAIKTAGVALNFYKSDDGNIVVDVPAIFTATSGVHYLEVMAPDKTISNVLVTVGKKQGQN